MACGARRKARDAGDVLGLNDAWAGLRAGDAENAEEELGVQQNTSAVYPTGRPGFRARHTAQLVLDQQITDLLLDIRLRTAVTDLLTPQTSEIQSDSSLAMSLRLGTSSTYP